MLKAIGDEDKMAQGAWPKLGLEICTKQHCACTISNGAMGMFNVSNLTGRVGVFDIIAGLAEKIMNSSTVAMFSTTIRRCALIQDRGTMCGKPLLEEVERRRLVSLNADLPCTTLMICNEDVTSLIIDTHKTSETLGFISSFCSSGGLIHGFNDGTSGITSSVINKFSFVVNICNCHRLRRMQDIVLHAFPVWVAEKIMLLCIISSILWSILEESVKRFPCGCTSGPQCFQIETRSEILLLAAPQWASMCGDALESVLL